MLPHELKTLDAETAVMNSNFRENIVLVIFVIICVFSFPTMTLVKELIMMVILKVGCGAVYLMATWLASM